ncbi:MAG: hypothetical protein ACRDGV_01045 [Candidatus Limnocylindria bacterium]
MAVGVGALFSGAALLGNIIIGLPLPLTLASAVAVVAAGLAFLLRRATPAQRGRMLRTVLIGAGAGILATLIYDAAKFGLSQLDPSPYNPFEATRIFGQLLIGTSSPPAAVIVAGTMFHLLNGTMFGLAYTALFAREGRTSLRYAALSGAGWGLFLETFQLTLYPQWLGITLVDEFVRISALSHLVYGASLGLLARWGFRERQRQLGPRVGQEPQGRPD